MHNIPNKAMKGVSISPSERPSTSPSSSHRLNSLSWGLGRGRGRGRGRVISPFSEESRVIVELEDCQTVCLRNAFVCLLITAVWCEKEEL